MSSLDLPFWELKSAEAGLPSGCSLVTASWARALCATATEMTAMVRRVTAPRLIVYVCSFSLTELRPVGRSLEAQLLLYVRPSKHALDPPWVNELSAHWAIFFR